MIFTMLFYRVVLTVQPSVFSDVELLKMKLYLVKGANKLIEEDMRHDNRLFRQIFERMRRYVVIGDRFLRDCSTQMLMFDEYIYLISRNMVYYAETNDTLTENINMQMKKEDSLQIPLSKLRSQKQQALVKSDIITHIFQLAEVYREHVETAMSQEEKAEREIEHSYLMLHLYHNPLTKQEEDTLTDPKVLEYRIMVIDMVISDTIKLLRYMTNHDAVYNLISNMALFRELPYMSKLSENKFMNALTDFTHPGGPYFPSRPVRQLAAKVMNVVFPTRPAKRARKLVHSCFRLMHPYYWAQSVSYHTLEKIYLKSGIAWGWGRVEALGNMCKRFVIEDDDLKTD